MPIVRPVRADDLPAISILHAAALGPGRFAKTAYRLREGAPATTPACQVCELGGEIIAAVRFTRIKIGARQGAMLLGPLAVHPGHTGRGLGGRLIAASLDAARAAGTSLVILVGNEPYYARHGFGRVPPGQITLPGPVDPGRILAAELVPEALADFEGPACVIIG